MKFLKLYPIEYLFSFGASDTWEWNLFVCDSSKGKKGKIRKNQRKLNLLKPPNIGPNGKSAYLSPPPPPHPQTQKLVCLHPFYSCRIYSPQRVLPTSITYNAKRESRYMFLSLFLSVIMLSNVTGTQLGHGMHGTHPHLITFLYSG
jgi:hypothetical protein